MTTHGSELDAVVSGFIILDSATLRPVTPFRDSAAASNAGNRRYMALLTAYQGSRFHPETIRVLGENAVERARTAGAVGAAASSAGYRGLILDFEGHTPADLDGLITVAREIADSARAHGVSPVAMAIPATDTVAYPARPLLGAVDLLVVMLYDQHWANSAPGPIAAPDWARKLLALRVSEVGASRIVAAFPVYGYSWRAGASEVIGFDDARRLAGERGLLLTRDAASTTLRAAKDDWETWVSDAVLIEALITDAKPLGVRTFALWRLGLEDPAVWTRLAR